MRLVFRLILQSPRWLEFGQPEAASWALPWLCHVGGGDLSRPAPQLPPSHMSRRKWGLQSGWGGWRTTCKFYLSALLPRVQHRDDICGCRQEALSAQPSVRADCVCSLKVVLSERQSLFMFSDGRRTWEWPYQSAVLCFVFIQRQVPLSCSPLLEGHAGKADARTPGPSYSYLTGGCSPAPWVQVCTGRILTGPITPGK